VLPTIQNNTIEFARFSRLYAARCGAIPALAAYPTLDVLAAALAGPTRADAATRYRLIYVIVAEYQAAPGPLWSAIALHAFRAMLFTLSRRLVGVDDGHEADALVAAGLLEALRRVRPHRDPDRTAMYVRQETRRAVFAALRRERLARQYWPEEEEEPSPDGDDTPGEEPPPPEETSFEDDVAFDDDAMSDMTPRDPLARESAQRRIEPDMLTDPRSVVPVEDRLAVDEPTVHNIPDAYLLRAHAVRGGLRRLAHHFFPDASAREREHVYRQLVVRTRRLLAKRA
jgi:DNA-directed RNA polymerase specialized sigma24 family protein